nr:MAG TPA: hypothetical protein [Caudoviricetes sp.]DAU12544.1 MAG TPA: hypothetical protein [Caudoviricetes sp.]
MNIGALCAVVNDTLIARNDKGFGTRTRSS